MGEKNFKVSFKGVRGSIPTPLVSKNIEKKIKRAMEIMDASDLKDDSTRQNFIDKLPVEIKGAVGGNSACVFMEVGGEEFIFDGGSGVRVLGLELMAREYSKGKGRAHFFLSHTHWDHILGIPFFTPLYVPGNEFTFYGVHEKLDERLKYQHKPTHFPVPFEAFGSKIDFVQFNEKPDIQIGDVKISWLKNRHPGDSYSYRIDYGGASVVYSTDAEYQEIGRNAFKDQIEFFKNADLLIFDAQYTFIEGIESKWDWGHSSNVIGVDIAMEAGVKKLALFHHEPTYDDFKLIDILKESKIYLKKIDPASRLKIILAQEGMELKIL